MESPAKDETQPCNVTMVPQMVSSVGIRRLGPILRRSRFDGSSERMYGLRRIALALVLRYNGGLWDIHICDGDSD